MLDPKEIEGAIVEHMKSSEPSYHVLAKTDLKLAEFSQTVCPVSNFGDLLGNVQTKSNSVQCTVNYPKYNYHSFQGTHSRGKGSETNIR